MAKNEAKIKFTAETGELNSEIKKADSSMREFTSELKLNATQLKKTGNNTKALQDRQKILANQLNASRTKTDALNQKLEAAKRIFGENSEEAKRLQTQLNNARTAEEKIEAEIKQTNEALKNQKTALDKVGDTAGKVGDKLTKAGQSMSKVSVGIVAAGTASIAAFNAVDEGADNAIKATGATGEAAEALEGAYKNVATNIVGDFGDIGSALGEVNTRFGFTGTELEKATEQFVKFSNVTGMDVTTAVQKVSRYMGDAGIDSSEYGTVLDNLTTAAQASGISIDTLAENLTKYGAPMRALGFETEETIAIFSSWEKAGVNTEIAFSGMKKAIGTWSKEGKDSRVEFKKTLEEIKNCPDIASATTKAIEVFGQKAGPDLADAIQNGRFEYEDMLNLIEGSKGSLDGTFDATVDGGYQLELAMQNAKVALGEVGNTLSSSLAPIVDTATEKLKGFADWWSGLSEKTQGTILKIAGVVAIIGPLLIIIGKVSSGIKVITGVLSGLKTLMTASKAVTVATTAATTAQTVATGAQTTATVATTAAQTGLNTAMFACPIFWIIAAIIALIAIIVLLVKNWDKVKEAGSKAWEGIKEAWGKAGDWFKGVWNGIKGAFAGVGSWFKNKFNDAKNKAVNAWNDAKAKFNKVKENCTSAFQNVGSWFRQKFTDAKNGVQKSWSGVKGFFSNIYSGITNTFAKVKNALFSPFKTAIDKIKGLFNKLKLKFPSIKLPHFSVSPKGWKIGDLLQGSIPKLSIDWYAEGGIMTKPTLFGLRAMGGGEAGPEAILPIAKLQDYIAGAIQKNIQTADLQGLAEAIEDLANRPVKLIVNGREFAQATAGDADSVNGQRTIFKNRGLVID